jgi:hypothetical protein
MEYNTFFNLYSNYIFVPIYFLIGLFFQLIKLNYEEIDKLFDHDNDDELEDKKIYNFFMINNPDDFYNLEKNKNIFIKKYSFLNKNQNQEQDINQEQNIKYENILTLRENICYAAYFYLPLHLMYLDYYLKNKPNQYTLYKLNTKTNDIIIDLSFNNDYTDVQEIIKKNYIQMINILEYSGKYNKKNFTGWKNLYDQWIKPIEPSDKNNYLQLIKMSFDQEQIQIENSEFLWCYQYQYQYQYTQMHCIRNFIQKDFFDNLQELYSKEETSFDKLSYLMTTYRIYNTGGNIITILH